MSVESSPRPSSFDAPDFPLPPLPSNWSSLSSAFVHAARANASKEGMCDSTGAKMTFGDLLVRTFALALALKRILGKEENIGLFLPSTAPGAVANLAVTLLGKTPVNLNYTAGQGVLDSCTAQAEIKQIITSPKIIQKSGLTPQGELIYLEDLKDKVTAVDKLKAFLLAKLAPISILGKFFPDLAGNSHDRVATIIFTSGSTGDPKGVILSQRNILSNVHQINNHITLMPDETVLGILPFFHSFGFTVTIWTAVGLGKKVVYHFNPLDARVVADLIEKHKVTLVASTPTFMRSYIQRGKPEQFKSVTHLLLGAEKLKPELAKEIKERIHVDPMEGYGCTETAPAAAINVPEHKKTPDGRPIYANRLGTVGHLLPGTSVKTIDPETGADLPKGAEGVICLKGPQIMVGYLHKPEATAKVLIDGWYTTGDLGYQDADGFLKITDRQSRFSKVAGEMVPHAGVEAAIVDLATNHEHPIVVTGIPDAKRGERLAVIYVDMGLTPEEVVRKLQESGMAKLWVPSADDFIKVDAVPILGTGKLDLRRIKQLAQERQN